MYETRRVEMALFHSFLQQEVVDLKSVATEGKVSVTKQFVALRAELDVVRKGILHREKASNRAMQDLEVQLKTKFEVDGEFECESVW